MWEVNIKTGAVGMLNAITLEQKYSPVLILSFDLVEVGDTFVYITLPERFVNTREEAIVESIKDATELDEVVLESIKFTNPGEVLNWIKNKKYVPVDAAFKNKTLEELAEFN